MRRLIFNSVRNYTCKTSNVVYCITCKFCNKQYIGETKKQLNTRISGHRFDITNLKTSLVSQAQTEHFNQENHDYKKHLKISILESAFKTDRERKHRE